jgi:protein ImuA
MAPSTMAREQLFALRQKIARIEGTQPERLEGRDLREETETSMLIRRHAPASAVQLFTLGVPSIDEALGGGVPRNALTEIIGKQSRDAAVTSGFAMALATLAARETPGFPVLWIGLTKFFYEAGLPFAPGLTRLFGFGPQQLLLVQPNYIEDALWAAEEAACQGRFAAILLELQGNPTKLHLTATRRLHHRARASGYPLFLVRHATHEEPTAAPTRFTVSHSASALRETLSGPVPRSVGPPAFTVTLSRSRTGKEGTFVLEWNPHEHTFQERQSHRGKPLSTDNKQPAGIGGLATVSAHRPYSAPAAWNGLAARNVGS